MAYQCVPSSNILTTPTTLTTNTWTHIGGVAFSVYIDGMSQVNTQYCTIVGYGIVHTGAFASVLKLTSSGTGFILSDVNIATVPGGSHTFWIRAIRTVHTCSSCTANHYTPYTYAGSTTFTWNVLCDAAYVTVQNSIAATSPQLTAAGDAATTFFLLAHYTANHPGCDTVKTFTFELIDQTDISGGTVADMTLGGVVRKKLTPADITLHAIYGFKVKITVETGNFYIEPNLQYLVVGCHSQYLNQSISFATTQQAALDAFTGAF